MANTCKKKTKKKANKFSLKYYLYIVLAVIASILLIYGINIKISHNENTKETTIVLGEEQIEPMIEGDLGEYNEEIPTVDEIDGGGLFKDTLEGKEGDATYYEKGDLEEVDTSSPEAFKNSTLGRCLVFGNYYGAQCVSLARGFWLDYAGYDVSTCGTGLAKGMMKCWEENARDKFKTIWNTDEIQAGTWIVLDGATTGHICMALGKVNNGYVTCLGENQGGVPCEYGIGGAGTNIINISVKNFIGGYTPIEYIEVPKVEPIPNSPDTGKHN